MPRIAGVDIPRNRHIEVSLTYIFGIGRSASRRILAKAGIDPTLRADKLSESEVASIRGVIEGDHKVEGDLRKDVSGNIKRLMDLGCYRGLRHRRSLPARGQRTHTNSRTRKGPRRRISVRKKTTG
jgi:small subunit ribosomal protein S13